MIQWNNVTQHGFPPEGSFVLVRLSIPMGKGVSLDDLSVVESVHDIQYDLLEWHTGVLDTVKWRLPFVIHWTLVTNP